MKLDLETTPTKSQRKTKEALDSRVFKDGQIYLYRRQDYKKPIWYCRVKVPKSKGYIIQSTKTADEHDAYGCCKISYSPMELSKRPSHQMPLKHYQLEHSGKITKTIIDKDKMIMPISYFRGEKFMFALSKVTSTLITSSKILRALHRLNTWLC
jgi:hypothetical protein